ncbi:MAG: lipase family protein [Reichenbachiella sp.]
MKSSVIRLIAVLVAVILYSSIGQAQITAGFQPEEARDMIALCNGFSHLNMLGQDSTIIPGGYQETFVSTVTGLDNVFKVYQKQGIGVLCFQGSTDSKYSWMENFHSAMVPAVGELMVEKDTFRYSFSTEKKAAVHSGYILGIALMSKEILSQVERLNNEGVFDILVTGHSQGGSIALLLASYLEISKGKLIDEKNVIKVYGFANPMIGNSHFVKGFNDQFAKKEMAYSIVNPKDMVPKLPLEYVEGNPFSKRNRKMIVQNGKINHELLFTTVIVKSIGSGASYSMRYLTMRADKQISDVVGKVTMTKYARDVNYTFVENRIMLGPFEYPKVLKDSSILASDSLHILYPKDDNGDFVDKELYKEGSNFYQHKPHNYYVAFLKTYFREEYDALERTYLIENL